VRPEREPLSQAVRIDEALVGGKGGPNKEGSQAEIPASLLDEFTFRFNRRKTNGIGRIAVRTIEQLVARPPLTMKTLIQETAPCRAFRS
jgi:hypothetical protein